MEKKLCRISLDGSSDHYLLTTIDEADHDVFTLHLTDGANAWSGSVTKEELKVLARKIKMNFQEFVTETKKAFSQEDSGGLRFQYQVKKMSDDEINFIWKKHIPSEKIKFQLGSSSLKMVDDPSEITKQICEYSIENNSSMQEKITSLESDNERLATERAAALKRLEKCVSMKEEMEKDLYENFVAVLNNKKEKIRSMGRELEDIQSGISDTIPRQSQSGTRRHGKVDMSDDDSEDEIPDRIHSSGSDYDTGDERIVASTSGKRKLTKEARETGANSSLILDADDASDSSVLISAKRRKRTGARELKNKTPSKPVLPKPSSDPKIKDSSGRRPSLRKSGSQASDRSNKSSDNLDVDNLMDDL